MAYDTFSLFDAIEADNSQQRVAARTALNVANVRVANTMGAFLRGARNEEEFFARLGLVSEDLADMVYTAAEECGHDDYKSIYSSIVQHYADLAKEDDSVEFDISPVQRDEDEEEEAGPTPLGKKADINPLDPMAGGGLPPAQENGPALGQMVSPFSSPSAVPLAANPATQANQNVPPSGMPQLPGSDPNALKNQVINQADAVANPTQLNSSWHVVGDDHWINKAIKHPGALHEELDVPEGEKIPEDKMEKALHSDNPEEKKRAEFAEELKGFHHKGAAPPKLCPHCGGNMSYSNYDETPGDLGGRCVSCGYDTDYDDNPQRFTENYGQQTHDRLRDIHGSSNAVGFPHKNAGDDNIWKLEDHDYDGYSNAWMDFNHPQNAHRKRTMPPNAYLVPREEFMRNVYPHLSPDDQQYWNEYGYHSESYPNDIEERYEDAMNPEERYPDGLTASKGSVRGSWNIVADTDKNDDKNTDLGGPEPKIDKDKQTDTNPPKDVLGDEDKGRWPTKRKDVTEVIVRENREVGGHPNHVLKEIGENTTTHYDLPAAKGDEAGFDPGGVTHEDGPFTFDNKGQQDTAVTRETQK